MRMHIENHQENYILIQNPHRREFFKKDYRTDTCG
jgi:hypothetical protein